MSAAGTQPLVVVDGLTRHFALGRGRFVQALDGVSFNIAAGEIVGLVGESGSGKSTLGKTLLGLHDKTGGSVRFNGEPLPARYQPRDFRRWARHMQMIFQDPYSSLNPRMTVGASIGEGLRTQQRLPAAEIRARVAHWLQRVGLEPDHMARYPHAFSGGQRQRIGIARALIVEPAFVVCDEPISALDVSVQAQVVNLLGELQHAMGLTLLFIAHDLSMVRYLSDRILVMYLGTLVEIGPADDVYFHPLHPYTELLIAANPQPDPVIERGRRGAAMVGESPSPIDIPAGCRFADRCPKVMDICRQQTPPLLPLNDGSARLVACHLYH